MPAGQATLSVSVQRELDHGQRRTARLDIPEKKRSRLFAFDTSYGVLSVPYRVKDPAVVSPIHDSDMETPQLQDRRPFRAGRA